MPKSVAWTTSHFAAFMPILTLAAVACCRRARLWLKSMGDHKLRQFGSWLGTRRPNENAVLRTFHRTERALPRTARWM